MSQNKALIIGIENYTDLQIPKRPGTEQTLRQITQRLNDMHWETKLMIDDSAYPQNKPTLIQLLDAIKWIKQTPHSLLLISADIRGDRLLPIDTRLNHLQQTTLPLETILDELDQSCGLILDASLDLQQPVYQSLKWIISANDSLQENELFSEFGPTRFLHAFLLSLDQINQKENGINSLKDWFEKLLLLEAPKSKLYTQNAGIESPFRYTGEGQTSEQRWLANGKYRLLRLLGEGGIGQVYLAEDTFLKEKRAVKLLKIPPKLTDDQKNQIRGRMLQSVKASQKLSAYSKHIVQVFDVSFDAQEEFPFMVMEFLKGETLSHRLYREALSFDLAFEISFVLAQTVGVAHEHKVIHRDLKPENVMLIEQNGNPNFLKLLDFDLVKLEVSEVKTQEGQVLGTLEYMAPEQLKGESIDPRADVYALGAIIYECFSGKRANPGKTQRELIKLLLDTGATPLKQLCPYLPDRLCELVDRCLSLNADFRPADATQVFHALEKIKKEIDFAQTQTLATAFKTSSQLIEDADLAETLLTEDLALRKNVQQIKEQVAPNLNTKTPAHEAPKHASPKDPNLVTIEFKSADDVSKIQGALNQSKRRSTNQKPLIFAFIILAISIIAYLILPAKHTDQVKQMDAENGVAQSSEISTKPSSQVLSPDQNQRSPLIKDDHLIADQIYLDILSKIDGDWRTYQGGNDAQRYAAVLVELSFGDLQSNRLWEKSSKKLRQRIQQYWQSITLYEKQLSPNQKLLQIKQKEYEQAIQKRLTAQNLDQLGMLWIGNDSAILAEDSSLIAEKCGIQSGDDLQRIDFEIRGYKNKSSCLFSEPLEKCEQTLNQLQKESKRRKEKLLIKVNFKRRNDQLAQDEMLVNKCNL